MRVTCVYMCAIIVNLEIQIVMQYILRVSNYKLQKQQRKREKKAHTHTQTIISITNCDFYARCNILFIECARCLLYVRLSNFFFLFFFSFKMYFIRSRGLWHFVCLSMPYDCDPLSSDLIGFALSQSTNK